MQVSSDFLLSGFNPLIRTSILSLSLKQVNFKGNFRQKNLKENYRPVSILKTSKISEKFIFKKIRNLWDVSPENIKVVFEKATT